MSTPPADKVKIAVFSGPTATIQNSPPLVTGKPAESGTGAFASMRPQRLGAPVTVYVEQFSAHPLERDAAELYGPPDGWIVDGEFVEQDPDGSGVPVYKVELDPSDGLFMLPYVARQADGSPWEDAPAYPLAPVDQSRQTFYPNAHRIYEEIDRFGLSGTGHGNLLSSVATFDFYRPAPSGGYRKGLPAGERTDAGEGDIAPERLGRDYFVYFPRHLRAEPDASTLARATNMVQRAMATGEYDGAQWLEGSPTTEESVYWLNLVIDTDKPIVGHSAQRPHGTLSGDGDANIVDGVKYIASKVWADEAGADRIGGVMIVDEVVFASREVTKTDARPGNYEATGGHGGIVASMGGHGAPQLTYIPVRKHTATSALNLTQLPGEVIGVRRQGDGITTVTVPVKDGDGGLRPEAMPQISIVKYSRWQHPHGEAGGDDLGVTARTDVHLSEAPLSGFVAEGASPYGSMNPLTDAALMVAAFSGMPVVKCGRGNTGGFAPRTEPCFVSGNNLTSTKARMLLMAAMLKLGALPPAADPRSPTADEATALKERVAEYQAVFDSH